MMTLVVCLRCLGLQAYLLLRAVKSVIAPYGAGAGSPLPTATSTGASPLASPLPMPVVLCGDFNSHALKLYSDHFDCIPEFPPGGVMSGPYQLISSGTCGRSRPSLFHALRLSASTQRLSVS